MKPFAFVALPSLLLVVALAARLSFDQSTALGVDSADVPDNTFTADVLNPPTAVTASGGSSVNLQWTATADAYAEGYRVFRGSVSGGPYTEVAQVTPRTTTSYADSPGPGTYFYVVRSFVGGWESVDSNEASATVN